MDHSLGCFSEPRQENCGIFLMRRLIEAGQFGISYHLHGRPTINENCLASGDGSR